MKRYIHASFDASMPEWLKKKLTSKSSFNNSLKENLLKKHRIALDKVRFLDHPSDLSQPVYNIAADWGNVVYIPGVNDDDTLVINGRNRKLGSIAKSKLPELASDVVYMDLGEEGSRFEKKDKYRDPRYTYRHNDRGDYAGQYKKAPYLGNGEYGPEEWSKTGRTPSNESRARDKSGYRILSPEQKIADYYTKFPDRITDKVDQIYNRIIEVRTKLASADIPTNTDSLSRAYRRFSDAIDTYNDMFRLLDEDRKLKSRYRSDPEWFTSEFSGYVKRIKDALNDVEKYLNFNPEL